MLKQKFGLELPKEHNRVISGLKDIRNCLAHHNGIVRPTDGKKEGEGKRQFHWSVFEIFAIGTKSGKKFDIKFNEAFEEEVLVLVEVDGW
jgi:hypothetical protein